MQQAKKVISIPEKDQIKRKQRQFRSGYYEITTQVVLNLCSQEYTHEPVVKQTGNIVRRILHLSSGAKSGTADDVKNMTYVQQFWNLNRIVREIGIHNQHTIP